MRFSKPVPTVMPCAAYTPYKTHISGEYPTTAAQNETAKECAYPNARMQRALRVRAARAHACLDGELCVCSACCTFIPHRTCAHAHADAVVRTPFNIHILQFGCRCYKRARARTQAPRFIHIGVACWTRVESARAHMRACRRANTFHIYARVHARCTHQRLVRATCVCVLERNL